MQYFEQHGFSVPVRSEATGETKIVYCQEESVLTDADFLGAKVDADDVFGPVVSVSLTANGQRKICDFSSLACDENPIQLAIIVDGTVICAPNLVEPFESPKIHIGGSLSIDEARSLASKLNPATAGEQGAADQLPARSELQSE